MVEIIKRECVICGKEFYTKPSRNSKYCSRICYSKRNIITKICPICKKNFDSPKGKNRKYCSLECMWKGKEGKSAYNWKGNKVGYSRLHTWIRTHKPKPECCEDCGIKEPYDVANISGEYKRDINDFKWLCRKCHQKSDGRLDKLKKGLNHKL